VTEKSCDMTFTQFLSWTSGFVIVR